MIDSQESKPPSARAAFGALAVLALTLAAPPGAAQSVGGATATEVRELGRLERPDLVPVIVRFLSAGSADVRAEAANALAQSLRPVASATSEGIAADTMVSRVASALRSRFPAERDPRVLASLAQSLGRIPYGESSERQAAKRLLVRQMTSTRDAEIAAGAARGLLALVRGERQSGLPDPLLAPLRPIAADSRGTDVPRWWDDTSFARPRRLAMLTLLSANSADPGLLGAASRSDDRQLRMLAARGVGMVWDSLVARGTPAARDTLAMSRVLRVLVRDPAPMVRTEVARVLSRAELGGCGPLLPLAEDSSPRTSLAALDAIGGACAPSAPHTARARAARLLERLVHAGAAGGAGAGGDASANRIAMHRAAHAIVTLARIAPPRARALLPEMVAAPAWQARVYAARAAAVLADTAALIALARDGTPNVRSEAVMGLRRVAGHAADEIYVTALSAADYQLVREAARALEGTPDTTAATRALSRSLSRITAEKRETSRDPRVAILHTLHGLGSAGLAETLLPYLVDFDPVVADSAAAMVSEWTGRSYRSAPRPLPYVDAPLPDLAALASARVRVTMAASAGGGSFEMHLLPGDAPLSVSRFVRLARSGYYDGLTVHRVVPNFVIQGGSPGANEYVGDGPFLRDEVGLRPHRRGAVGISTRGRNTGDAQFFVDLVDVPRLDHEYTVFAEVVRGMDVVDEILEGDVMESVRVVMN